MINLRNVRPLAIIAGAGAGAVGLPFLHDLIAHPIAGGIYLLAGCALTVKAQQHSADKAEEKAVERELKAMAKAERKLNRRQPATELPSSTVVNADYVQRQTHVHEA